MSAVGRTSKMVAFGLIALPCLATLGEGGAEAGSLLAWHGWLLLLLLWALLAPEGQGDRVGAIAPAPLKAGALFLALTVLGAVFAPFFFAAWLTCLEIAVWFAVLLLAARSGEELLPNLRRLVVAVAAAQGLLALYQRMILGEARPPGTFLNPNYLACWLAMALILSAGAWRRDLPASAKAITLALAAPSAAALFLTGSRGGMLALAAGLLWLLLRSWRSLRPAERRLSVVVIVVALTLVGWRMAGRLQEDDPFRYQRAKIWKATAGMVMEEPWWGTGPGQFGLAASSHQFADGNGPLQYDRSFRIPHSDLLRAPAEFGIPAALALFAAVVLAVLEISRRRFAEAGPQAALIAVGFQALVDDPSHWPAVYLLTAVLLGRLLSRPAAPSPALPKAALAGLVAVLLLVFAVGDVAPTASHLRAVELPAYDLTAEQGMDLTTVLRLNPIHPGYWRRRAESLAGGSARLTLESYASAREAAERAVRLNPADGLNHWMAAKVERRGCLELFRDRACLDRVSRRYRWAQALKPYDVRISLDHGQFLLAAGEPLAARRFAERALTMEPLGVAPRLLLAESLVGQQMPDVARAVELAKEAQGLAMEHSRAAEANEYSQQMLALDPRRLARLLEQTGSQP
jgi:O-antigen ligase